jgi:hypothetical protein
MLNGKYSIFIVILPLLFTACQANPVNNGLDASKSYPYPSPAEVIVGRETVYPLPLEIPVIQETINPYPAQDDGQTTSELESTYAPKPEDAKLEKGLIFTNIEDSGIQLSESFPVQVTLILSGDLPTPCHQLRVRLSEPDSENRIQVQVYSVVDPNMICTQVIKPFETQVALGSFESGKYTVYINGEYLGEFTI